MSFASVTFLWLFLPIVLVLYWIFPARFRNIILSISSLIFYAFGAHNFVFVLIGLVIFNYFAGRTIGNKSSSSRDRNLALTVSIIINLLVMVIWKYGGFFNEQLISINRIFGGSYKHQVAVLLPLGISFFTFHNMSYLIDVRRNVKNPIDRFVDFATYIVMFPQLIAGPIVRYHEISEQLTSIPEHRFSNFAEGFPRFAHGLFKKVVIADSMAPIANAAFGLHGNWTTSGAWLGAFSYTLQIYFDFSGYSDMAIGLGKMFGFNLPENFRRPYSADSITDFWRRWHMSLSRWFRDYLYIPLGGNRGSGFQTYRNLLVVFILTGFWHGAAWTFVAWGLYHGFMLIIERLQKAKHKKQLHVSLRRIRTFIIVIFGWVLFRSANFTSAWKMAEAMVTPHGWHLNLVIGASLTNERLTIMILASAVLFFPGNFVTGTWLVRDAVSKFNVVKVIMIATSAFIASVFVLSNSFHPFLYFQF